MCYKKVENLVYQDGIGRFGLLDIYVPKNRVGKALLIYFHGGGLESGDKSDEEGVYCEMASNGFLVVSANYRMYPDAKFPDFVEDAAKAVSWSIQHVKEYGTFDTVWIGGISAGSYLSMMLHFNPDFLGKYGVEERKIAGYIFDAGQPTVHYNILRERGMDPNSICVDEAAPIYYLRGDISVNLNQHYLILVSDHDIVGRKEQNELLIRTMETHQYKASQVDYRIMKDCEHVAYVNKKDENGMYPYARSICQFIQKYNDQKQI